MDISLSGKELPYCNHRITRCNLRGHYHFIVSSSVEYYFSKPYGRRQIENNNLTFTSEFIEILLN